MASHFHIPGSFEPHALTGVSPATPPQKRKRDSTRESTPARDVGDRRYVLAGQLDTPGGLQGGLDDSVHSDVAYRRQMGPRGESGDGEGWRSVALGAIGGVVGRVWEFCKAGAFKGFYAGGGRGYAMDDGKQAGAEHTGRPGDNTRGFSIGDSAGFGGFGMGDSATSFQVGRPEDFGRGFPMQDRFEPRRPFDLDFHGPETEIRSGNTSPAQPSAKRRHVNDDLNRSWVMVDSPHRTSTRRRNRNSSPSVTTGRRISAARPSTGYKAPTPLRTSRVSHAGSPALSPREPASFAAQRSPVRAATPTTFGSPSRIPLSASRMPHRRANSSLSSPSERRPHTRTGSLTEPHRPPSSSAPAGSNGGNVESPRLDPEARRLAARREREEREADEQMAAFNLRLRDMIREGKEALGTSFEVEEGEGGGCVDG